jgi:hypothetical protein
VSVAEDRPLTSSPSVAYVATVPRKNA